MATMVSPGASVTLSNNSQFVAALSSSTPIIFIATSYGKSYNGKICPGTIESGAVRTITGVNQLFQMYGTPTFYTDKYGNSLHGAAQNEYGLWAAYNYLLAGSACYIIRANVDTSFPNVTSFDSGQQFTPMFEHADPGTFVYKGGSVKPGLAGLDKGSSMPEEWTIQFNGATFDVVGSVSGVQAPAYINQPYNTGNNADNPSDSVKGSLGFVIANGTVRYQVGDYFLLNTFYDVNNIVVPTDGKDARGNISSIGLSNYAVQQYVTITIIKDQQSMATTPGKFKVTYERSSKVEYGTIGTPFNNGVMAFLITEASTGSLLNGDVFAFDIFLNHSASFNGYGNGTLDNIVLNPYSVVAETWTLAAKAALDGDGAHIIPVDGGNRDGTIGDYMFFTDSSQGGQATSPGTINLTCVPGVSDMNYIGDAANKNSISITATGRPGSLNSYVVDSKTSFTPKQVGTLSTRMRFTPTVDAFGGLGTGIPLKGETGFKLIHALGDFNVDPLSTKNYVSPALRDAADVNINSIDGLFSLSYNSLVNGFNDYDAYNLNQLNGFNIDQQINDILGIKTTKLGASALGAIVKTTAAGDAYKASLGYSFNAVWSIDHNTSTVVTPDVTDTAITVNDFQVLDAAGNVNTAVNQSYVDNLAIWNTISLVGDTASITLKCVDGVFHLAYDGFSTISALSLDTVLNPDNTTALTLNYSNDNGATYNKLLQFNTAGQLAAVGEYAYNLVVAKEGILLPQDLTGTWTGTLVPYSLSTASNNAGYAMPVCDPADGAELCTLELVLTQDMAKRLANVSLNQAVFGSVVFTVDRPHDLGNIIDTFSVYDGFSKLINGTNVTIKYIGGNSALKVGRFTSADNSVAITNPQGGLVKTISSVDGSFAEVLTNTQPVNKVTSGSGVLGVTVTVPGAAGDVYSFEIQPVFQLINTNRSVPNLETAAYALDASGTAWEHAYIYADLPNRNSNYVDGLISVSANGVSGNWLGLYTSDDFAMNSAVTVFTVSEVIDGVVTYISYINNSDKTLFDVDPVRIQWVNLSAVYDIAASMPKYQFNMTASAFSVEYITVSGSQMLVPASIGVKYNYSGGKYINNTPFSFLITQGVTDLWKIGDIITATISIRAFSVVGSVSGIQPDCVSYMDPNTFDYDNGIINFVLTRNPTMDWSIGDKYVMNVASKVAPLYPNTTTDKQKRALIVSKLTEAVNSNIDIRSDNYLFSLAVTPGYHEAECIQALQNLSIAKFYEVCIPSHTPYWKAPEEAAIWGNTSERRRDWMIWYNYASGMTTNVDGSNIFIDGTSVGLRLLIDSDANYPVWFAPAGVKRGIITSLTKLGYVTGELGTATTFVETPVTNAQRDVLYQYFVNLNPATVISGKGILMMGQKTSDPSAPSSLDRINVARLVSGMKREIRFTLFNFVMEMADAITQTAIKTQLTSYLSMLMSQRALYDFIVICDSSNNSSLNIDRNEIIVDIAIKAGKAAEFILANLSIVSTSATFK